MSNRVQTLLPNARVNLKNLTTSSEISTVSNDLGSYAFTGVLPGDYEVSVELAGFEPLAKGLKIEGGDAQHLDLQLTLKMHTEMTVVTAEASGVDFSSSSGGSPSLNADILKSVARLNQDFQEALPLLPGVVRGLDGLIRIKGGRTNQTNTLREHRQRDRSIHRPACINASRCGGAIGQVLSNPFDAEYGRFASGVVDVSTRGGTEEWKWQFEDPVPRFRWIDYRRTA